MTRNNLLKYWLAILFAILPILSCSAFQNQRPVIKDIIYAREVPASFETLLICRADDGGSGRLEFEWTADNGTIKGGGESITWVAPDVPGIYKIGVKITDAKGMDNTGSVNIKVVPFNREFIDITPDVSMKIPIWSNDLTSAQQLVNPLTTADIECLAPLATIDKYTYTWSCNGGKMNGTGIEDGSAFKIGWVSPGVPGCYTVMVKVADDFGNLYAGSVYFNVINPSCCGGNGTCGAK